MKIIFFLLALVLPAEVFGQIPQPTDAPAPLTPEETAASYKLPPGFRLEVVASEPLIASPSGVCWDERGRMFVCELHGYNLEGQLDIEDLNKAGKLDTQVRRVQADEKFKRAAEAGTYGVVKLLLDTNGDGRMDKAQVWSTNLPPAYGIVPARGGVIVACAPDIVFLADRDEDGVAEVREKLFTGFQTGALERGINAPQWGSDGWIYFGRGWGGGKITGPHLAKPVELPGSDFRIRADGTAIEPVVGNTHTFGFAMAETGDRFTVTTTVPGIYIAPLPWRYLLRNRNVATPSLEAPTGDRRAYSISKPHPWRQKRADDPEYFKYYNSRYGAAESEADGWFTAACSPMIYRDRVLPGLHGQYFVCEPAGNLVHRAIIQEEGSTLTLQRAKGEERSEFAASSDPWSHPMNLAHGPDGCIWITDYYREIIEDYSAIPRHLQQQYGVYKGHDRGRIYRLSHEVTGKTSPTDLRKLSRKDLAMECASPVLWRRQTAQRLIVEARDHSAIPVLRGIVRDAAADKAGVITSLHTLEQLGALKPEDLELLLEHSEPAVRVHVLQLADHWFSTGSAQALVEKAIAAAHRELNPRVQIQFALSLGESPDSRALRLLAKYAREQLDIRWLDTAILSSVGGREVDLLAELLREPGNSEKFIPRLAQAIAAAGDQTALARATKLLGYATPGIQASALEALARTRSASSTEKTAVTSAPLEQITEKEFGRYLAALGGGRDLQRGHELYLQACATCHRIGKEGSEVGPDLIGQLGMSEEALLKDILLPNDRIRPGFETTEVLLRDGSVIAGLLKEESATSLLLLQPGGVEQSPLRKDVTEIRRQATSLMPAFREALAPEDVANLLGWLRSNLKPLGENATKPVP